MAGIPMGRRANLVGAGWMVAAMAAFAVEDALLKSATRSLPIGQVMMIFGLGGALVFALLARLQRAPLFTRAATTPPMLIRVVFEITGRLFYTLAIALTPLSAATVILQATPLVVVASAAVIFGERVGWRRWTAIALGLIGVVIIIGPGRDSFSPLSILALIGMIGFAGRDLASRAAPATVSTNALGFYGFLAMTMAGGLYAIWDGAAFALPGPSSGPALAGAILTGVFAYSALMKAMRTGEVSAVTPLRYSRLLFGVALGLIVFGEALTLPMLAGSALIVISGLFTLLRTRPAGG